MSTDDPDGMKEDVAAKQSAGAAQEVQPQPVSSEAKEQERTRRRARTKTATRYVVLGVVIVLVAATIHSLIDFFYGEKRKAEYSVREAQNFLDFERKNSQRLERDLADRKGELAELIKIERACSSELASVKAALIAERERRVSIGVDNADLSKRIAKLTESLALAQQALTAPDAKLAKAKEALDRMRKQHKDFMAGVELGRALTGDDFSVLADIFTAPDELRSSKELTAATVAAYESRIQTVDTIVRSALAAEKYLSQKPAPETSPAPRN
jgi:chromosome segregation ATPase